mgnify:CR=1 FL=1
MSELWHELNEELERVDEIHQTLLKRQNLYGDPISERFIKRRRDLKVCVDALASIDSDLVDVSVSDSAGDGDDPAPPQRELGRQEGHER